MKLRFPACGLLVCHVLAGSLVMGFGQQSAPDAPSAAGVASELTEARELLQKGKTDDAIAKLQRLDPSTKGVALELGNAYYKKSDFSQAIQYLKKANAEDAANQEGAQLLGM